MNTRSPLPLKLSSVAQGQMAALAPTARGLVRSVLVELQSLSLRGKQHERFRDEFLKDLPGADEISFYSQYNVSVMYICSADHIFIMNIDIGGLPDGGGRFPRRSRSSPSTIYHFFDHASTRQVYLRVMSGFDFYGNANTVMSNVDDGSNFDGHSIYNPYGEGYRVMWIKWDTYLPFEAQAGIWNEQDQLRLADINSVCSSGSLYGAFAAGPLAARYGGSVDGKGKSHRMIGTIGASAYGGRLASDTFVQPVDEGADDEAGGSWYAADLAELIVVCSSGSLYGAFAAGPLAARYGGSVDGKGKSHRMIGTIGASAYGGRLASDTFVQPVDEGADDEAGGSWYAADLAELIVVCSSGSLYGAFAAGPLAARYGGSVDGKGKSHRMIGTIGASAYGGRLASDIFVQPFDEGAPTMKPATCLFSSWTEEAASIGGFSAAI